MSLYWIHCRSLTHAQRASMLLERDGFTATLTRTPQGLSTRGCGYAVIVRKDIGRALALLREKKVSFGKVYTRTEAGEYREVTA